MLSRATRQLQIAVHTSRLARAFGSSHHDHHDEHHDDGHHPVYYNVHKHQSNSLGRNRMVNLRILNDITHNDPSHPEHDFVAKRGASYMATKMDPRRHIYMHHNPIQNYDDHFFVGDFPTPDLVAEREPSRAYREQAVQLAQGFLAKARPQLKVSFEDWEEARGTSWQLHGIQDIDILKFEIWDHLSDNIIVKENKFRPRIEQRLRREAVRR